MVFCLQNYSDLLLWEKKTSSDRENFLKFIGVGQEIRDYWNDMVFNKFVQLWFKLEKWLGFRNIQEKLDNVPNAESLLFQQAFLLLDFSYFWLKQTM